MATREHAGAAPLWSWADLAAASGGRADCTPPAGGVTGVSIDTRIISAGDLFVALTDQRDGHEYVGAAFAKGAAAALVADGYAGKPGDGPLLRVAEPLRALERIGIAARARLAPEARVIAVTGSAGKTGSKEMLRLCLCRLGATHASDRSYNNHWGVPLTLARMPAATRWAAIEIGMNHAGEITPLTRMARPHVAIVTNVLPVHLGHFDSEEGIAEAKAEIFLGLEPGGVAVVNRDQSHFHALKARAEQARASILPFGEHAEAIARLADARTDETGTDVLAHIGGRPLRFRVGAPGRHLALNAVAVLAAIDAAGGDAAAAAAGFAEASAPAGRGARALLAAECGNLLLIDESYNANPASMRAAFDAMAITSRQRFPRRIAVLGDMRELGERSAELHQALAGPIDVAGIDLVFACGPFMQGLFERLPSGRRGAWAATSTELVPAVLSAVRAGDVVMVKGSLGTRMAPIVDALRARHRPAAG